MIASPRVRTIMVGLMVVLVSACASDAIGSDSDLSGLSEFQKEILEDGSVTYSELERAVLAFVDCAAANGVTVEIAYREDIRAFEYAYTGSADSFESDLAEVEEGFCQTEFKSEVELVWADQAWTAQDDEAFYSFIADCLTSRGIPVSDPLSELGVVSQLHPMEYDECFDQAVANVEQ